jgi:hypothetical protein
VRVYPEPAFHTGTTRFSATLSRTGGEPVVATLQTRVSNLLRTPATEWPVIARESTDVGHLYAEYIAPLAAIPVLAGFIGLTLIAMPALGLSRPFGLSAGFTYMVVQYLLSLAAVYISAVVVEWLAPKFKSSGSRVDALKLVAYSCTAGWVFGVFSAVPLLGFLTFVGFLYTIYLFYVGLPHVMNTPADQVVIYLIVIALVIIGLYLVFGSIAAAIALGNIFANQ